MRPLASPLLCRMVLIALCCAAADSAWAGRAATRREAQVRFAPDEAFQAQGGVQYFYELVQKGTDASAASPAFGLFRDLDPARRWAACREPVFVVMVRFVYLLDRDVSFFSRERVLDPVYMNRVCPSCGIRAVAGGHYRVKQMPANTSRVQHFAKAGLREVQAEPWFKQAVALSGALGPPEVVVLQENFDFESIFGMRTGEGSVTVTTHHAVGPGKTRVAVHMLTLMHNVPPFFLGGEGRVLDTTLDGALTLIDHLRRYEN